MKDMELPLGRDIEDIGLPLGFDIEDSSRDIEANPGSPLSLHLRSHPVGGSWLMAPNKTEIETKAQVMGAPPPKQVCGILWLCIATVVGASILLVNYADTGERRLPVYGNSTEDLPALGPAGAALALDISHERRGVVQAAIFVCLALFASFWSVGVTTFVVIFSPDITPPNFWRKATLSTAARDISTPHGRIYSVALFTTALLSLVSMYPCWLYRSWVPWVEPDTNPLANRGALESQVEVFIRCFWGIFPHALLMFTATITPTRDENWYGMFQTWLHNLCAPGSMSILLSMECWQLAFGEQAFGFFFSEEPVLPPIYGPLTIFQRVRVVVAVCAAGTVIPFAIFQMYLLGGETGRWKAHSSYYRAMISFLAEVVGMVLILSLPAIAAVEELYFVHSCGPVVLEAKQLVKYTPWHEF